MNKFKLAGIASVILMLTVLSAGCGNKSNESDSSEATEQTTQMIDIKTSDIVADENIYSQIDEMNKAAASYYSKNFKKIGFLSVYGYLYNASTEEMVNISDIEESEKWTCPDEIKNETEFIYIKPEDLNEFENIVIENPNSKELELFTALITKDGVIISSENNKGGMIKSEEYKNLLLKYSFEHGSILNSTESDEQYTEILDAVIELEGDKGFTVKHLACNDKYAAIVVGEKENPASITEYALQKIDDKWTIIVPNLEMTPVYKMAVNMLYPDFELGLLPIYNIASFGGIESQLDNVIESAKGVEIVNDSDLPAVYSCASGHFVYFEFKSGKKLLGFVNDKRELKFYEVNDIKEAIQCMVGLEENPPVFILNIDVNEL